MTWAAYRVTLRLLSPLHSGWRKLGNVQQTRPYVTGRSLWGALTARLTRELGERSGYEGIGKQVDQQLAFTYFYPSTEPDGVLLWPWRHQWDEFAWTFLGSYASTALENARNAEEGSLHETEYIAPYTRTGQQVYLIGYVFEQDTCELDWQGVLNTLQFGGERSYGWGRVHLQGDACQMVRNGQCFEYDLLLNGERPHLRASKADYLLAHTSAEGDSARRRDGAIEPLVGRETAGPTAYGEKLSRARICWGPGGNVTDGETFQILPKGIWKLS